jgi:hypothetical protein
VAPVPPVLTEKGVTGVDPTITTVSGTAVDRARVCVGTRLASVRPFLCAVRILDERARDVPALLMFSLLKDALRVKIPECSRSPPTILRC